tara:strand:+ start:3268 stop:3435 length:168 start_codon:yes stop_codon:yes gene_type:complete
MVISLINRFYSKYYYFILIKKRYFYIKLEKDFIQANSNKEINGSYKILAFINEEE